MRHLLFTILFTLPLTFYSQTHNHDNDHDHQHDSENHNHNGFELGVGGGIAYAFHEKDVAPGLHLHGLYNHEKWVYGVGFESVFLDENHYNISGILGYRPVEALELSVAPGILLENEETGKHLFSMHFEAVYLFEIENFGHLGPVISYAKAGEDQHGMIGVHFGFHF